MKLHRGVQISPVLSFKELQGMSFNVSSNIPSPMTLDKSAQSQSASAQHKKGANSGNAGAPAKSVSDNVSLSQTGEITPQKVAKSESVNGEVKVTKELDANSAAEMLHMVQNNILQNAGSSLKGQANHNAGSIADLLE
jgi:hypothetical protein